MADDWKTGRPPPGRRPQHGVGRLAILLSLLLVALVGAVVPRTSLQESRRTRARDEMAQIRTALVMLLMVRRPLPESIADFRPRPMAQDGSDPILDTDLGEDPWGRPYGLTIESPDAFTITCRGADGVPGGEGFDADIDAHFPAARD